MSPRTAQSPRVPCHSVHVPINGVGIFCFNSAWTDFAFFSSPFSGLLSCWQSVPVDNRGKYFGQHFCCSIANVLVIYSNVLVAQAWWFAFITLFYVD